MIFASTSLVFDPPWPWSLPMLGWPALVLIALLLSGLTVLTYLVGQRASTSQFAAVLAIRLTALLIICLVILRPALAQRDDTVTPSKLIILVDSSASMNNKDEFNSKSRWEAAWRLLQSSSVKQILKRLQDEQAVEVIFYQGAEKLSEYQPEGKADGKRTDIGQWLHTIWEKHGNDPTVRGIILLTDGADNGTTFAALDEAKNLKSVHTVALGSPKTTADEKDIYFANNSITVNPAPVPVKGKMTVKAVVNAPGLTWAQSKLHLSVKDMNDKEVGTEKPKQITLQLREGNKVEIETDAPAMPGDYKVTLKIDPLPYEVSDQNNEISTYVTATKDGISVLWVERNKRLESTWILKHALSRDPKIRVFYSERPDEKTALPPGQKDWFNFDKQHYDVIVIGDISAQRFTGGDKAVLPQMENLVKKGSGLLMLGGYESFASSDWHDKKYASFTDLLPVTLDKPGQVEGTENVSVQPTSAGLDHFLLKLVDDPEANKKLWTEAFRPLDGMTRIGTVRPGAVLLATDGGDDKKPVMAFWNRGGRVAVFGGDTTWKAWRKKQPAPNELRAVAAHEAFWKKMIHWLAQKEKVGDDVWVTLATRRLPAGGNHSNTITVGLNPDKSKKHTNVTYKVRIIGPGKKESIVTTSPKPKSDNFEQMGTFWQTSEPGEYLVQVDAFDAKGAKINTTTTEARFLTYAQDLESLVAAADHAFLTRLAAAGGGQFRLAGESELADLLDQIAQKHSLPRLAHQQAWPDWDRNPISNSPADQVAALITSGVLFFYLLFCGLLCLEWLLRRRWNMV